MNFEGCRMKSNTKTIFKLFDNYNNSIFLCDSKLNVTEINNYTTKNNININVSDNLFSLTVINSSQLDAALYNLNKGLPFHSTNFVFNLLETAISFFPIINEQNNLEAVVCYLDFYNYNNDIIKAKSLTRCIGESFEDPTIRILNTLSPIAHKLDLLEQYDDLEYLNSIANNCYRMLKTSISTNEYYKLVNNKVKFNF